MKRMRSEHDLIVSDKDGLAYLAAADGDPVVAATLIVEAQREVIAGQQLNAKKARPNPAEAEETGASDSDSDGSVELSQHASAFQNPKQQAEAEKHREESTPSIFASMDDVNDAYHLTETQQRALRLVIAKSKEDSDRAMPALLLRLMEWGYRLDTHSSRAGPNSRHGTGPVTWMPC